MIVNTTGMSCLKIDFYDNDLYQGRFPLFCNKKDGLVENPMYLIDAFFKSRDSTARKQSQLKELVQHDTISGER